MNKTMSIKLDENLFENVKKISSIFNMTSSEFIRNAIKKELEEKNNAFILKLSDVPLCDDDEEKELVNILNTLTEEDLKVAKKEIVKL
jgi:hypothetical protein